MAVLCAILVTFALGGTIVALLLYRAITSPQLGRVLVVRANEQWDGVELIVEGGRLVKPKVTWVERLGNYTVPFFLEPGKYTLHVKSEDVEVYHKDFDLTEQNAQEFDLARSGATTRPSTTRPAARAATAASTTPAIRGYDR